jgi:hypothetical protein
VHFAYALTCLCKIDLQPNTITHDHVLHSLLLPLLLLLLPPLLLLLLPLLLLLLLLQGCVLGQEESPLALPAGPQEPQDIPRILCCGGGGSKGV